MIKLAEKVPSDCDGLITKPNANTYDGLQGFENIKENHTCGHFARAIMQSTSETLKNLIDCLCTDRMPLNAAATGGGAKSDFWLKICSEKTGIDIFRADCPEPACKGAAIATR